MHACIYYACIILFINSQWIFNVQLVLYNKHLSSAIMLQDCYFFQTMTINFQPFSIHSFRYMKCKRSHMYIFRSKFEDEPKLCTVYNERMYVCVYAIWLMYFSLKLFRLELVRIVRSFWGFVLIFQIMICMVLQWMQRYTQEFRIVSKKKNDVKTKKVR